MPATPHSIATAEARRKSVFQALRKHPDGASVTTLVNDVRSKSAFSELSPTLWNLRSAVASALNSLAETGNATRIPTTPGTIGNKSLWSALGDKVSPLPGDSVAKSGKLAGRVGIHVVSPPPENHPLNGEAAIYRGTVAAAEGMRLVGGMRIVQHDPRGVHLVAEAAQNAPPVYVTRDGAILWVSVREAMRFGWSPRKDFNLPSASDATIHRQIQDFIGGTQDGHTIQEILTMLRGSGPTNSLDTRNLESILRGLRNAGYVTHTNGKATVVTPEGKTRIKHVGRWRWVGPMLDEDLDPHSKYLGECTALIRPW